MSDIDKTATYNISAKQSSSFLSDMAGIIFWAVIGCIVLWNWDGFWQTDIKSLEKIQRQYFYSKYSEEQLKLSRITNNNKVIDDIQERLDISERLSAKEVERATQEKDSALSELAIARFKLNSYLKKENTKCRYYDTSLRMIDQLIKRYSEDDLQRILNCTNSECQKILYSRREATEICNE
ncbi:MAG: hypothetical protein ACRC2W_15395 [Plesiomonas shigelloides]